MAKYIANTQERSFLALFVEAVEAAGFKVGKSWVSNAGYYVTVDKKPVETPDGKGNVLLGSGLKAWSQHYFEKLESAYIIRLSHSDTGWL